MTKQLIITVDIKNEQAEAQWEGFAGNMQSLVGQNTDGFVVTSVESKEIEK